MGWRSCIVIVGYLHPPQPAHACTTALALTLLCPLYLLKSRDAFCAHAVCHVPDIAQNFQAQAARHTTVYSRADPFTTVLFLSTTPQPALRPLLSPLQMYLLCTLVPRGSLLWLGLAGVKDCCSGDLHCPEELLQQVRQTAGAQHAQRYAHQHSCSSCSTPAPHARHIRAAPCLCCTAPQMPAKQ